MFAWISSIWSILKALPGIWDAVKKLAAWLGQKLDEAANRRLDRQLNDAITQAIREKDTRALEKHFNSRRTLPRARN